MEIRNIQPSEVEAVRQLLVANDFGSRVHDVAQFQEMVERADRAILAVEDGEVVGFARALTDGISNGYLSMLVVAESHRRRGIGRALVHALMGEDRRLTWVLRSSRPAARAFYERIGFVPSSIAMERPRG
jgi:ribosomal protein S18 acetylase RimI-like enzyme